MNEEKTIRKGRNKTTREFHHFSFLFIFIFITIFTYETFASEININNEEKNNEKTENVVNIEQKITENKEEIESISGDIKEELNKQKNNTKIKTSQEENKNEEKYFINIDGGFVLQSVWEKFENNSSIQLEKFYNMIKWIEEEGGYVAPLSFQIEENKIKISAKEEILKEEKIIKLPLHVLFSTSTPSENEPSDTPYCDLTRRWPYHEISKIFANTTENFIKPFRSSKVLLSLCLIHEMKKTLSNSFASFYRHYFDTLPLNFDQPITWKESEVERLKGSAVYSAIYAARKQLNEDYYLLSQALFTHPSQGFTQANYNWAMLFVTSKIWNIHLPDHDRPIRALVPIIDHLPFSFDRNSKIKYRQSEDKRFIEFFSNVPHLPHSNIYDIDVTCYTSQCLFLNHGIIIDENPYDYLPLTIINSQNEIEYLDTLIQFCSPNSLTAHYIEKKISLLLKHNLAQVKIAKGGSKELYASFRILAMETSEIDSDDLVDRAISGEKVSTLNDNLMSTILSSILRSTLSSYPTSLHYDKLVLGREKELSKMSKEYLMATKLLVKEKEILSSVLDYLSDNFDA